MASSIIEQIMDQAAELRSSSCSISYFYFKHDQPDKRTHKGLLRAVLDQLITQEAALSHEFLDEFSSIDSCQLSIDRLQTYAKTAFDSYNTSYVIVDGIDECSKDEARKSVKWLLSLAKAGPHEAGGSVKVLVSGQRDGVLDILLESHPAITLETPSHSADIHQYCEEISGEIQTKFRISDSRKELIVYRVTNESQGKQVHMDICTR